MKSLLLLDADVAIHFHELSYWEAILKQYKVYLPSVVVGEIKHYETESGKKVLIDLNPHIETGQIVVLTNELKDHSDVLALLKVAELDEAIDDGELDCLVTLYKGEIEDLVLGLKDGIGIKSAAYLDLDEKCLSIEEVLKQVGILRPSSQIPREYSTKRFKALVTAGKFLQIEKPRVKAP